MASISFGRKVFVLSWLLVGIICLPGCPTPMEVKRYPKFYTFDLKNVTVAPFHNATSDPNAGKAVSDCFARALMENKTYQVCSINDLQDLITGQDLKTFVEGNNTEGMTAKLRPATSKVQALLVGTVNTYNSTTESHMESQTIPYYDGNTWRTYTRFYTVTTNTGDVSCSAAMLRISDGKEIHAVSSIFGRVNERGEFVRPDKDGALRRALNEAITKLVREFAVTDQIIKITTSKNFRTASDFVDGQWVFKKKFYRSDPKIVVMLQLPDDADRNDFVIDIVRDGGSKDNPAPVVKSIDVKYESDWGPVGKGFEVKPADLLKNGEPGWFVARLYRKGLPQTNTNQILEYYFKISEDPKN